MSEDEDEVVLSAQLREVVIQDRVIVAIVIAGMIVIRSPNMLQIVS